MIRPVLFVSIVLSCFTACNKENRTDNDLIGTWKLISYCKPGGTITCNRVTVPSDKGVFISFTNNKEFREYYQNTKPIDYAFLGCGGGSYEIETPNIRIRAICMSSSNGQLFEIVSLSSQRLVLNPFKSGEYIFEKQ